MRRLIALMLGVLAIAAGAGGYFDQVQRQQQLWLQAAADVGVEFAIPLDPKLADPDTAYQILTTAADGAGSNVFRTAVEYGADDGQRIVLYTLLTSPTDIERAFPLTSGRWLAPDDAEHPERFVSSAATGSPDQVGRLTDFGGGDDVSVRSQRTSFESMPTAGVYVAATPDAISITAKARAMASRSACGPSQRFDQESQPTRLMFALNAVVKSGFTLALMGAGAGLWLQYESASAEHAQMSAWDRARGYAIFYPVSNGNDQLDMASGSEGYTPSVIESLYPLLNARAALFIDALEYQPVALAYPLPPGAYRSVTVNVNFLRRFPLNDADGQPVEVADTTTDWVVLVPERLHSQAVAIETWLQQTLKGRRAAEHVFGGSVPDAIANQSISIRWIADDQGVFSFNPLVNSDSGNMIRDPIAQVMTSANSVGIDRANAITGDVGAALKVAIGDVDTTGVLASLQPDLRNFRVDDNLRHLVTLQGYIALEVARIENTIRAFAIVGAVLLVGLLYLSAASVAVLFERYSRRVVVRRLHGAGFVRRYREPSLVFAGVWIGQLVGALAINHLGANPFSSSGAGRMADDRVIVAVALAVAVLEASMSAFVISSIERRGLTRLLKEEF